MEIKRNLLLGIRSWGRIITYSAKRYASDQLAQQSIVLTYYTLFSIVPMAALVFGITKGFGLDNHFMTVIYERFPEHRALIDYICDFAEKTLRQSSGGVVAGVGIIALFLTVIWLINSIEKSFNVIWGLPARKDVFRKLSSYLSLVFTTPIMMVLISTLGMTLRRRLDDFGQGMAELSFSCQILNKFADIVPMLATCALFFVIYLLVPNTKVRWRGACVAGIIAGICFQVLQDSFLFLQSSVFSYNRIYGSFAILPLFLVWVNWSWQIILIGAEICFVHQHLKSGVFNEDKRKKSMRLRREYQLAILAMVFREFEKGAGAMSESRIALTLRLPDVIMRTEIGELVACGLLCRTVSPDGDPLLLPGVPPEHFTIVDYLHSVSGTGETENGDIAKFDRALSDLENIMRESKYNLNIHEI